MVHPTHLEKKNTIKTYFILWQKGMVAKPMHCVIQITMQDGVRQMQSRVKYCRYLSGASLLQADRAALNEQCTNIYFYL